MRKLRIVLRILSRHEDVLSIRLLLSFTKKLGCPTYALYIITLIYWVRWSTTGDQNTVWLLSWVAIVDKPTNVPMMVRIYKNMIKLGSLDSHCNLCTKLWSWPVWVSGGRTEPGDGNAADADD